MAEKSDIGNRIEFFVIMEIIMGPLFKDFISGNRERTLFFLKSKYSVLSEEDLEDIYQESSIALFRNIQTGKITELSNSLYPYFLKICINQSMKAMNKTGKHIMVGINDSDVMQKNMVSLTKVENIIRISSEGDVSEILERKNKLVHSILDVMTPQCKKLLWSFYAEDLNWTTIAQQNGLSNANSAKSSANRCRNSFREKYNELKTRIYG